MNKRIVLSIIGIFSACGFTISIIDIIDQYKMYKISKRINELRFRHEHIETLYDFYKEKIKPDLTEEENFEIEKAFDDVINTLLKEHADLLKKF